MSGRYAVEFERSAKKELDRLDGPIREIRQQLDDDNDLVLARRGTPARFSPPRWRLLVVIDQFNEVLTRWCFHWHIIMRR